MSKRGQDERRYGCARYMCGLWVGEAEGSGGSGPVIGAMCGVNANARLAHVPFVSQTVKAVGSNNSQRIFLCF